MSVNGRFDSDAVHQQSTIHFGAIEFLFNDGAILRNSEGTKKSKRTVISLDERKIWVLFASPVLLPFFPHHFHSSIFCFMSASIAMPSAFMENRRSRRYAFAGWSTPHSLSAVTNTMKEQENAAYSSQRSPAPLKLRLGRFWNFTMNSLSFIY